MTFSFNPMTEKELNSPSLVEEGEYHFEVLRSFYKISRPGNEMSELKLRIFDKNGKPYFITARLIFSDNRFNLRYIKHFCLSTGIPENYEKGQLPHELSGLNGICLIGIQEEKEKEGGGFHPKQNYVIDWLEKKDILKSDDVPF